MRRREGQSIPSAGATFTYEDACALASSVSAIPPGMTITVDFHSTETTTTAAMARLILLRRGLLRMGRDLRVAGIHGRVRSLYEMNRLGRLLPGRATDQLGGQLLAAGLNGYAA